MSKSLLVLVIYLSPHTIPLSYLLTIVLLAEYHVGTSRAFAMQFPGVTMSAFQSLKSFYPIPSPQPLLNTPRQWIVEKA